MFKVFKNINIINAMLPLFFILITSVHFYAHLNLALSSQITINFLGILTIMLLIIILFSKKYFYFRALTGTWFIMIIAIIGIMFFTEKTPDYPEPLLFMMPQPKQIIMLNGHIIYGTVYQTVFVYPPNITLHVQQLFPEHFSFLFILLTSSCIFLHLIGPRTPKVNAKLYFVAIILTELLLFFLFSTKNILNIFYILFEAVALPMFFI